MKPVILRPGVGDNCPTATLYYGRHYIGIDLNEDYLPLAMNRVQELPAPAEDDAEEGGGDAFDLFSDG